jgi:ribosomal RNA methyltransferase Nop2
MAVVRVLSSFKALRPEGAARADYVKQLQSDLSQYYGYNDFLISTFLQVCSLFLLFMTYLSSGGPSFTRTLLWWKTCLLHEMQLFTVLYVHVQMFPPAEVLEFLEANEKPRPISLRTNTLKVHLSTP